MPQASLGDYFLKDYKGGGVFEHEAYEHEPDEWCWIHKSSGIKARDRRHLTRFVTPRKWRSRLGATPAAAPGRCGRMPWTWLSPVEVAKSSASFITRLSWGSATLLLHRRKPLKSSCCTQSTNQHVMWCHVTCVFLLAHLADGHSLEHPKASLVTSGPNANAWWGRGRASHGCASIILQLLYHNWQNVSICFTVCGCAQQGA